MSRDERVPERVGLQPWISEPVDVALVLLTPRPHVDRTGALLQWRVDEHRCRSRCRFGGARVVPWVRQCLAPVQRHVSRPVTSANLPPGGTLRMYGVQMPPAVG